MTFESMDLDVVVWNDILAISGSSTGRNDRCVVAQLKFFQKNRDSTSDT